MFWGGVRKQFAHQIVHPLFMDPVIVVQNQNERVPDLNKIVQQIATQDRHGGESGTLQQGLGGVACLGKHGSDRGQQVGHKQP